MPRKQVTVNESSAAAAPARAAKPKAPRVKSAKHTSVVAPQPAAVPEIGTLPLAPLGSTPVGVQLEPAVEARPASEHAATSIFVSASAPVPSSLVDLDPREEIARIAYGYWQARGCVGGDPLEDWVRAENEYRLRLG